MPSPDRQFNDMAGLIPQRFDDRVVALVVEAGKVPGMLNVRRQRRGDFDHAAARDAARRFERQESSLVSASGRAVPV